MWTLFKGCLWFSLVLIALPLFDADSTKRLEQGPNFETAGSVSAAMSLYQDVTSICEREPDVCDVAGHTVGVLGARAKEGARIAYQFLDDQLGDTDPARNDGPVDVIAHEIHTSTIYPTDTQN